MHSSTYNEPTVFGSKHLSYNPLREQGMNLTLMHPQKHVRKKIMKACNYFQILHEGDVQPLLQVGKKVALMQIFFRFLQKVT